MQFKYRKYKYDFGKWNKKLDNGSNDEYVDTTEDIPAISSNIQTTDAVLETSEEMEGDEDKENAEVVEGSVEVSENFVSSTGP